MSKFKPGDRVRVKSDAGSIADNLLHWLPNMDDTRGCCGVVESVICDGPCDVRLDGGSIWYYDPRWLEPVTLVEPPDYSQAPCLAPTADHQAYVLRCGIVVPDVTWDAKVDDEYPWCSDRFGECWDKGGENYGHAGEWDIVAAHNPPAELAALRAENERLKARVKQSAADATETLKLCRDSARRVLPAEMVDGESHFVPCAASLCDELAHECVRLKSASQPPSLEQAVEVVNAAIGTGRLETWYALGNRWEAATNGRLRLKPVTITFTIAPDKADAVKAAIVREGGSVQ